MLFNYLTSINNTFYFRLRVPKDLQQYIPRSEIKKSLRTKNASKAKSLAKVWMSRTEEMFMLLRSQVLSEEQALELISRLLSRPIPKSVIPAIVTPHSITALPSLPAQEAKLVTRGKMLSVADHRA